MRVSIDIAVQRCAVRKVVQMMQHASVHLAHHYGHRWYAGVSFGSILTLLLGLMVEFMLAIDTHFQVTRTDGGLIICRIGVLMSWGSGVFL